VPAWLVWLLPVPVATLSAVAWAAWTSRVRGPADPLDSIAEHERFRQALARPLPQQNRTERR
jgi:anti-sigma factor RsiW